MASSARPRRRAPSPGGFAAYPGFGDPRFAERLSAKLEMQPEPSAMPCGADTRARFNLHPVQQFVLSFMSPATPYRSLLMFHDTGVGKTCTAANVAEAFASDGRRPLLLVPGSVAGQFRQAMFDADRVPEGPGGALDPSMGARSQCTGLAFAGGPAEGVTREQLRVSMVQRLGRRFRMTGHEEFGNAVDALVRQVEVEFASVSAAARELELAASIRRLYGGRLIVVDEAHDVVPRAGAKQRAYDGLRRVLTACGDCRLLLMTATPMFDRASEALQLVNLLLLNEGRAPLEAAVVFDNPGKAGESLRRGGAEAVTGAALGMVSFATGDDPKSFPAAVRPDQALIRGEVRPPPALDASGAPAPPWPAEHREAGRRGAGAGWAWTVEASLSPEQAAALRRLADGGGAGGGGDTIMRQVCNLLVDPSSDDLRGEAQIRRAFQVLSDSPSSGLRLRPLKGVRNPFGSPEILARAPKVARVAELVSAAADAGHTSLVYTAYVWAGVVPVALALEMRGFAPERGRPILDWGGARAGGARGTYVIVSKTLSLDPGWGTQEKVAAVNAPGSRVRVVIGTEVASQGLDLRRVRAVHMLEPWYNSSRAHQVLGRAIRRCSHSELPPAERNVTFCVHVAREPPGDEPERETVDVKALRFSATKRASAAAVEAALRRAAADCDLYGRLRPARSAGDPGGASAADVQTASTGAPVRAGAAPPEPFRCALPWAGAGSDRSTFHPSLWARRTDMASIDVAEALAAENALTFEEIKEAVAPDHSDLAVALAIDQLLDPVRSRRFVGQDAVIAASGVFVRVPRSSGPGPITIAEVRRKARHSRPLLPLRTKP